MRFGALRGEAMVRRLVAILFAYLAYLGGADHL
jgi:hypothetical protein